MFVTIILYTFCIIVPIVVLILEVCKINVSILLKVIMAKVYLKLGRVKKAKAILVNLVNKYERELYRTQNVS